MTSCTTRVSPCIMLGSVLPLCLFVTGCALFSGNSVPKTAAVTISASPASISMGATSTLTVVAVNASQVTIAGSDGSTYSLSGTGGSQTVKPAATTSYTATVTGLQGNASATATVTVTKLPAAAVTIAASHATITVGGSSTLTVAATNANQVTVSGSDGSSYTMAASGGTQSVSPTTTTTYTVAATGAGGNATANATVTVNALPTPAVTITANPPTVTAGSPSTLTVAATNAAQVTVSGTDGSSYTLKSAGGTQSVSPTSTTTYTATATGAGGTNVSATATVTVITANLNSINHVIFLLQENHSFDNYFGMLNPYRKTNGWNIGDDGVGDYEVDGIDDKLNTIRNVDDEGTSYPLYKFTSSCIDDESSDWLASYGDVNRYDFSTARPILMDGFVHNAEGYAKSCSVAGAQCSGNFTDLTGQRAMGYYDQDFLNYYYFMASQFALSDRWFSPVSSKSIDNRVATFTGGTTQGIVKDPGGQDHLPQLDIPNIFQELDQTNISWKIYYTVTQGFCLDEDDCQGSAIGEYPATNFSTLAYSLKYIYENPSGAACAAPTQPSSAVGDKSNSFCVDPVHITPLSTYFTDVANGTLPSFAFIEAGYGNNDEHPGSGQSILEGQAQVAHVMNSLMTSPSWSDSVLFFSYDEGGGPYDHVPPVAGHSNDNTDASLGSIPDVSQIVVNPDQYNPCVPSDGTATTHSAIWRRPIQVRRRLTRRPHKGLRPNLGSACRISSSRPSLRNTTYRTRRWITRP